MRYDDRRPVPRDSIQGFLNNPLTTDINRAGGFIQDQDGGVSNDAAGYRKPLSLAAAELDATFTDFRFVALLLLASVKLSTRSTYVGQFLNKVISKSFLTGFPDHFVLCGAVSLFPFSAVESEGNVVEDCVVEEKGLLLYEANLGSPPFEIDVLDVSTSDADLAMASLHAVLAWTRFLHVRTIDVCVRVVARSLRAQLVPTLQQRNDGTFARARRTNQSRSLAFEEAGIVSFQHLDIGTSRICKVHILNLNVFTRRYLRFGNAFIGDSWSIDSGEELACSRDSFLDRHDGASNDAEKHYHDEDRKEHAKYVSGASCNDGGQEHLRD